MNFQKYILCDDPVENILEEGQVTGFRLRMMQGAYKGTRLSYFQDIVVLADGERFSLKEGTLTFTLASGSYRAEELSTCSWHRWNFCEKALIVCRKPGGLADGTHHIEAGYSCRDMFGPRGDGLTGGYRDITMEGGREQC